MPTTPLRIDPRDPAPIWRQIEEGIRRLVATGGIEPGLAVPSVRELARELRVNPNTVAKAYQRLADVGVLQVKRGEGTFVADAPPSMTDRQRSQVLDDAASRLAMEARTVGASRREAHEALDRAFDQLERGREE